MNRINGGERHGKWRSSLRAKQFSSLLAMLLSVLLTILLGVQLRAVLRAGCPFEKRQSIRGMEEDRGTYTVRLVQVPLAGGGQGEGYWLCPKNVPEGGCPAVLLLHDHGARFSIGKEKMVRSIQREAEAALVLSVLEESQQWVNVCYDSIYLADTLAARGFAVLVTDALYWGSRAVESFDRGVASCEQVSSKEKLSSENAVSLRENQSLESAVSSKGNLACESTVACGGGFSTEKAVACEGKRVDKKVAMDSLKAFNKRLKRGQPQFYARHLEETGEAWFETILQDDKMALEWLKNRPEVNPSEVGVCGFSMGAYRAWNLASEASMQWCVAANWFTSIEARGGVHPDESSWSMYRQMNDSVDYPEIAARSQADLLIIYGRQDHLFPQNDVQNALVHLFTLWPGTHVLDTLSVEADHQFTRKHLEAVLSFAEREKQSVVTKK